jgi:hypothetical protein
MKYFITYLSSKEKKGKIDIDCKLSYKTYSVFQGFSIDKSANGGSISSLSQFLILPQLPRKIKLTSKVVKIDSKIIISLLTI